MAGHSGCYILKVISLVLIWIVESSAQSCSTSDLAAVKTCATPVQTILDSINSNWPVPVPLPGFNTSSLVDQLCSTYSTFLTCVAPRNANCGNVSDIVNIVSVAGYVCVTQRQLFNAQVACISGFLASPNPGLKKCIDTAADAKFHNLVSTTMDSCNAYKDATSCVYPLVQTQCGANFADALQEYSRRVVRAAVTNCDLIMCSANVSCMYDETCRSDRDCQCATVCPQQTTPQCASNGQIYGNRCLLRKQACRQRSWMLERPAAYCSIYSTNPSQCTDDVIDKYAHCIIPLYNGMINSFKLLDKYLSNFNNFMVNRTCNYYNDYKSCSLGVPPICALSNGVILDELYQKYVCTNQGFTDLTTNTDCWKNVGADAAFQQCSQDFGYAIDDLPKYNSEQYVDSFIYEMGSVCTALNTLGNCIVSRVQALCNANAVAVFNKMFQTYKMFMVNCNSVCKSLVDSVYGVISSNNWPAANSDEQKCTWTLQTPSGLNVNLLLRVSQPFDCFPDNPKFVSIYYGPAEDESKLVGTYCGDAKNDNLYSTPNGINQMTVAYKKTMPNGITSPPFVALFYAGNDACLSNPCFSGSTCHNTAGGYFCQCPAGFAGSLCDRYLGKCNKNVCKNGGTCFDTFVTTDLEFVNNGDPSQDFGYYCQCPKGFGGGTCESASIDPSKIDVVCPTRWVAFSQKCFFISANQVDEPSAESGCLDANANSKLASIRTEAERNFIQQLMTSNSIADVWLGGRHDTFGGVDRYTWLDQTTFNFTAWAPGQPDNTQRCVMQSSSSRYLWKTSECFPTTAGYVCRMDPPINCDVNPCINGGTCTVNGANGVCTCPSPFAGAFCDQLATCDPNPCLNGGQCGPVNGVPTCTCPSGFNGTLCEINTNVCGSNPCQNGGRCVANGNVYRCSCVLGFEGTNCETNTNECASSPCQNGGTCTDGVNSFTCRCAAGYSGTQCSININECSSNPCLNSGTCVDGVNSYTCQCLAGYSGINCQTATSSCATNPCQNGGTCTTTTTGYSCFCTGTGFTGTNCETDVNECASNPCQNGGTCQNLVNLYQCTCLVGFSGINCQTGTTTDQCASKPCANNATCISSTNSFTCLCPTGFFGVRCDQSSGACNSNPCSNGGTCIELSGSFTCKCPSGFSGQQCQIASTNPCLTNNPCVNGGVCSVVQGITVCTCPTGFQGTTCAIVGTNQCQAFPCQNGGTCVAGVNYYICLCATNYFGFNCQLFSGTGSCASSPCKNGATCVPSTTGFTCTCASGWAGTLCDLSSNTCSNSLCQNGATCVPTPSLYTCTCPVGYSGNFCDVSSNACLSNPCQNGGVCTPGSNSFKCACPTGYAGPICSQLTSSLCAPNPCQHSGTCVPLSTSDYLCKCSTGWVGASCEVDQNECLQTPCKHDSVCTNTLGSYYCTCSSGFTGADCSLNTDACSPNPCSNGGTCSNVTTTGSYKCTCPPEYTGAKCESSLCPSGWKFNGGYCYTVLTSTVSQAVAKKSCVDTSAQLVSIHDVNERNFVAAMMSAQNVDHAWLGAEYNSATSSWAWSDGSTWSYTLWDTGFPTSPATLPCSRSILRNGLSWENRDCTGPEAVVCKSTGKIVGTANACFTNPCKNGGTCTVSAGTYLCTCVAGFGGLNCEQSVAVCQSNPCANGGTCKVVGTGYVCSCKTGFTTGSSCQSSCPTGWKWYRGKCYLPMNTAMSYNDAANTCPLRQSNSRLYYVDSQDEFYYAATLANQMSSNIWLGLVYQTNTGQYKMTDGHMLTSSDYTAWALNQPSSPSTNNCVQVVGFQGFTWETANCSKSLKFICKWDGSNA